MFEVLLGCGWESDGAASYVRSVFSLAVARTVAKLEFEIMSGYVLRTEGKARGPFCRCHRLHVGVHHSSCVIQHYLGFSSSSESCATLCHIVRCTVLEESGILFQMKPLTDHANLQSQLLISFLPTLFTQDTVDIVISCYKPKLNAAMRHSCSASQSSCAKT